MIGSDEFVTTGQVQVSGLAVGGTVDWVDHGQATQSGDDVVVGDSSGDAATLTIAAGGVYAISDDTGVDRGTSTGSMIYNLGTFGKTGGSGTSVIAVDIHDSGTIENTIAGSHLEFDGARNVFSGIFTGPGMIDFGPDGVATLSALEFTDSACGANSGIVDVTGLVTLDEGSTIVNEAGASWNFYGDVGLALASGATNPLFTNDGYLTKASGAGTSAIAIDADNAAGGLVTVKTGTLAFDGPNNTDAGTIAGQGTFDFGGGESMIEAGARFTVAALSISGSGTEALLDTNLFYANAFSLGAGATLDLNGSYLVLTGASDFSGGTVGGSSTLYTRAAADVSGLTVGGTAKWVNASMVTQQGGNVTIGDSTAAAALLSNTATGVYDIADDSGIGRGASASSFILNPGEFEKSGGTGTSVITPNVYNSGLVMAGQGVLDFTGSLTGKGEAEVGAGATLELGGQVTASQTLAFSGSGGEISLDDLEASGAQIFHGVISGFATDDKIDIGAATFVGFQENVGDASGVMTLRDGSANVSITLLGDYASANFSSSLAGGRTVLTYSL